MSLPRHCRGWRWWYKATGKPGWMRGDYRCFGYLRYRGLRYQDEFRDDLDVLERIKRNLELELEDIRRRIDELRRR